MSHIRIIVSEKVLDEKTKRTQKSDNVKQPVQTIKKKQLKKE